jgi:competence protein ComEC
MTAVAVWVATLPGALWRITAFGAGPLLLCPFGFIVFCLLKTPLRFVGALLMGWAALMMLQAPQPDVLVAADATAVAVRGRDGRLAMVNTGSDSFAFREWLAADGDPRAPKDVTLRNGMNCDAAGCIAKLKDGALVSFVKRVDAFEEDCRRAAVVVSARQAPPDCAAIVIDQRVVRASGAIALRRVGNRFEIEAARPRGHDRPWARNAAQIDSPSRPDTAPAPDATPKTEDLEPGD